MVDPEIRIINSIMSLHELMINDVQVVFSMIHFDLLNETQVITNMNEVKNIRKMIQFVKSVIRGIKQKEMTLHSFTEDGDSPISMRLRELLDKIPTTYFQILMLEEGGSFRYYSSVNNTEEHIIKVLKKYITFLRENYS